jgi:hypothetical protein
MSRGSNTPPIVAGFIEGLLAPLVELVSGVMVTALNAVGSAMGSTNLSGFVALISIADFVRNILLGLSASQFALGNLIGNILGIVLFYGSINSVSSEAANYSLLLAVILTISWVVGACLWLLRRRNNEDNYGY